MPTIDLFCRVVDNYGDIGVCWRLARQLVAEHDCKVRLIVDDLVSFRFVAPEVDPRLAVQTCLGVDVVAWTESSQLTPAGLVIEALACDPPYAYVEAMATLAERPVWINLEYLSAEAWVDGVHGLPSPHPRLPLTKYFFCPGFTAHSGGLIRERALAASPLTGDPTPLSPVGSGVEGDGRVSHRGDRVELFAFAYPHAHVLAVATALDARVTTASHFDETDPAWLCASPVPQTQFDALLAKFDVLIVRGEDSFMRAQYAAKPFLWHIYPTPDNAHFVKLDAWLDRYCEGLEPKAETAFRQAQHGFNAGVSDASTYADFAAHLPTLNTHAARWRDHLFAQIDLATRLVNFVNSLIKQKVS